jgi:hypothetical protein
VISVGFTVVSPSDCGCFLEEVIVTTPSDSVWCLWEVMVMLLVTLCVISVEVILPSPSACVVSVGRHCDTFCDIIMIYVASVGGNSAIL